MKKVLLFVLVAISWSCVELYEEDYTNQVAISVDGFLSDTPNEDYYITLQKAIDGIEKTNPILNAEVYIVVDQKERIRCTDSNESGTYLAPKGFKAEVGKTYALDFKLENGRKYSSKPDSITKVPPIDSIYEDFKTNGFKFKGRDWAYHDVLIDTKDPMNTKNEYLWTYTLWEKQDWCDSCANGRLGTSFRPPYNSVCVNTVLDAGKVYDYACNTDCWEVLYNKSYQIFSDKFTDGKTLKAQIAAKIPFYKYGGALLEIRQHVVSPSSQNFLKILVNQTQNSGGLVDTPPAPLTGNVRCITDPSEVVGGTFLLTSSVKKKYWIKRTGIENIRAIGLFGGRFAERQPGPPDPPLVPCVNSKTRTKIKPTGWVD